MAENKTERIKSSTNVLERKKQKINRIYRKK